jgi:P4 family phage/plasmid primase-like protien
MSIEEKNKKARDSFFKLLKSYRKISGEPFTHTSLGYPKGCYDIKGGRRPKLIKLYGKALRAGAEIHLTETHRDQSPVLIDCDWKYNYPAKRYYTLDNIKVLIGEYNKVIKHYLQIEEESLLAFVMEKEKPTSKQDCIKDGIHIVYPNICINNELAYVLRNEVVKVYEKEGLFNNIPITNTIEDVIDKSIIKVNWLMYGSKKPLSCKYELTHIYDENLEDQDMDDYTLEELIDLLSIRRFNKDDLTLFIDNDKKLECKKKFKELNFPTKKKFKKGNSHNIEIARELLKLLNVKKRSDSYEEWITLGWCLHNIDKCLLDDWIEFSLKCPDKFVKGECEKRWKEFREEGLQLGTLHIWARDDNPNGYHKFKMAYGSKYRRKALDTQTASMADAFFEEFTYNFKWSPQKKTWYEFKNHRWEKMYDEASIMNLLNNDMVDKFSYDNKDYSDGVLHAENDEDKERFISLQKKCASIQEKLRGIKFKEGVIKELKTKYQDVKFSEDMDGKPNLLVFNNGVLDLGRDPIIFRDGYPGDNCTKSTGIDFIVKYDENNKHFQEVENFFKEVIPEDDVCMYLLKFLSSSLNGSVKDQKFHIATGSGSNGKSVVINLLINGLGDYAITLPNTLLTKKKGNSSGASPELVMLHGVRFCVLQEPEGNDKLNVGFMKELTGGDKLYARGLFQEGSNIKVMAKFVLTCNKMPKITSNDGGTWRRMRVIPFELKFVDNPTQDHHRQIDRTIEDKIEIWTEYFIRYLVEIYKTYKKEGLSAPPKVCKYTEEYQKKSDLYQQFIKERIEKTKSKKDFVSLNDMYDEFKLWFKESHTDKRTANKNDFKEEIEDKLGLITSKGGWKNYKFKYNKDFGSEDEELDLF